MASQTPITEHLQRLKAGDQRTAAERAIWDAYFSRLAALAKKRMSSRVRRVTDEEDVVVQAFAAFFDRLYNREEGQQFEKLSNSRELWQLMASITIKKALQAVERELAEKRGAGRVRGNSAFGDPESSDGIENAVAKELTPEFADEVFLSGNSLLDMLQGDLREIAELRLMNFSTAEIAGKLNCTQRTIQRRTKLIRNLWKDVESETSSVN